MTAQINKYAATALALSYADAMNLTARREYHPQMTPRKVLESYLFWSNLTGITLHNDAWLAEAERVVDELNESRRAAWSKALRNAS